MVIKASEDQVGRRMCDKLNDAILEYTHAYMNFNNPVQYRLNVVAGFETN